MEQLERVEEEGYIRYKFRMETLPQVFMPFYMLVPEAASAQKPTRAVIAIPAHGANKDTVAGVPTGSAVREKLSRTPKEAYGLALVKRGYVALCPDPPGYGERIEPLPTEARAFAPSNPENVKEEAASVPDPLGCSCKDLAQTAEALSLSLTALEIWDLMRLVDFAAGRKEIDEERIGCIGFSGGGQYAMWLAAMDQWIQAAGGHKRYLFPDRPQAPVRGERAERPSERIPGNHGAQGTGGQNQESLPALRAGGEASPCHAGRGPSVVRGML